MDFKKYITITTSILLVFSVVIFVLGLLFWAENTYTGIIYLIISGIQIVALITLYPRARRAEDMQEKGNRVVFHNWSVLSVGIAGAALFLAPFFRIDSMTVPFIAFILCVLAVILSAVNIFTSVKMAQARMII